MDKPKEPPKLLPPRKPKRDISTPGEMKSYTVGPWITAQGMTFWRWDDKIVAPDDPEWKHISWRTIVQANCPLAAISEGEAAYLRHLQQTEAA